MSFSFNKIIVSKRVSFQMLLSSTALFIFTACLSPQLKHGASIVQILFQNDNIKGCNLVSRIDTGSQRVNTFQDAQIVLRNTAFDMGANAIRIDRFEPGKKANADVLKCSQKFLDKKIAEQNKQDPNNANNSQEKANTDTTEQKNNTNPDDKSNRNRVVTGDTVRQGKLYWQRCGYGQYMASSACQGSSVMLNWRAAIKQCENLDLADKSWRLPTAKELQSLLIDVEDGGAQINRREFPGAMAALYWSSERYDSSRNVAWTVDFKSGNSFAFGVTNQAHVRCVSD